MEWAVLEIKLVFGPIRYFSPTQDILHLQPFMAIQRLRINLFLMSIIALHDSLKQIWLRLLSKK